MTVNGISAHHDHLQPIGFEIAEQLCAGQRMICIQQTSQRGDQRRPRAADPSAQQCQEQCHSRGDGNHLTPAVSADPGSKGLFPCQALLKRSCDAGVAATV